MYYIKFIVSLRIHCVSMRTPVMDMLRVSVNKCIFLTDKKMNGIILFTNTTPQAP